MATLHEYQAKEIFKQYDIAIPRGRVAFSAAEVREIATELNCEVVVKAQVHNTSRAASGGIKFAANADEAFEGALEIFEKTGAECVLVDEKLPIEREFYLGFIIDTALKRPTLLFSNAGGSGIEERAETMAKMVCSITEEPTIEDISHFIFEGFPEFQDVEQFEIALDIAEILQKLYCVAKSCEARTAEINPLALLKDGRLIALDARISVDDYAVFRHPDLPVEMARELGHTPTKLEKIAWEVEKDDFRGTFFFVEILQDQSKIQNPKSKIGFHGAGGGGSMASLDAAQRNGLQPACYVDTSGNPPASKVYRAAKIILSIPEIKGYFLSGSGVASQEQFGLARAVLKAFLEVNPNIPIVLRLGGNGEEIAKELVEKYAKFLPAPIEVYQKQHSADFCAARLNKLIQDFQPQINTDKHRFENKSEPLALANRFNSDYEFKTKTGKVSFDYSVLNADSSAKIVESCPQKILSLNAQNLPVLNISEEEAIRGKCSECLACEFASMDLGLNAVKIDFPINELTTDEHR